MHISVTPYLWFSARAVPPASVPALLLLVSEVHRVIRRVPTKVHI